MRYILLVSFNGESPTHGGVYFGTNDVVEARHKAYEATSHHEDGGEGFDNCLVLDTEKMKIIYDGLTNEELNIKPSWIN